MFQFDPKNPCPAIGGNVFSHKCEVSKKDILLAGAYNQVARPDFFVCEPPCLPLSVRPDVLVFRSEILTEPTIITGSIFVDLFVSSDCQDTDFTAKLIDEYPPSVDYPGGFAMNICHGIQRCRFREVTEYLRVQNEADCLQKIDIPALVSDTASNSVSSAVASTQSSVPPAPSLLTPHKVYCIRIELFPTSNVFVKGHRIRMDISSSCFPHFDVNPNTPEGAANSQRMFVANNTVFHSANFPSLIHMPIESISDDHARQISGTQVDAFNQLQLVDLNNKTRGEKANEK
jgi:hypothetical protein